MTLPYELSLKTYPEGIRLVAAADPGAAEAAPDSLSVC